LEWGRMEPGRMDERAMVPPLDQRIADLVAARAAFAGLTAAEAALLALRLRDQIVRGLDEEADPPPAADPDEPEREPAVRVEDSVRPQFLVCLETGARIVLLERHLAHRLHMTPEQYRRKWGLPPDDPMVAEQYRTRRAAARAGRTARGA
jgi:predicted transcriptional regulator